MTECIITQRCLHSAAKTYYSLTMSSSTSTPLETQPDRTMSDLQDLPDIRSLPAEERHALGHGGMIRMYRGRGVQPYNFISEIPVELVKKASVTSSRLLSNMSEGIHLSRDVDVEAVLDFLSHLAYIVKAEDEPQPMEIKYRVYEDLATCAVAWILGMQFYTEHIYNFYWDYWNENIPAYSEVTLISNLPVWMDKHDNLFNKFAHSLAELVREDYVPDPEYFQAYLDYENPRMRDAIAQINDAHAERARRVERASKAEQATRQWKEHEETAAKKQKEARTKEKEKFTAIKARDAALEQAIKDKMKKAGQTFTAEEKKHWIRTRGSRPPKGR